MSYIIREYPPVATALRALPGTVKQIAAKTSMPEGLVRDSIKLLLAVKKAYCSDWTPEVFPIFEAGSKENVPRPLPALVRREATKRDEPRRKAYLVQYRKDNKEKIKKYNQDNKDRFNAKRVELAALRRKIRALNLVAEPPRTRWIPL